MIEKTMNQVMKTARHVRGICRTLANRSTRYPTTMLVMIRSTPNTPPAIPCGQCKLHLMMVGLFGAVNEGMDYSASGKAPSIARALSIDLMRCEVVWRACRPATVNSQT